MTVDCEPMSGAGQQRLRALPAQFAERDGFSIVLAELRRGGRGEFRGVWGSSSALLAAALAACAPDPLLVVLAHDAEIDDFIEDFRLFSSAELLAFPQLEDDPGEKLLEDELYGDRLRVLKSLLRRATAERPSGPAVIVSSISGLLQPVVTREGLAAGSWRLERGDRVDLEHLLRWLVGHGFHATSAVELPGEISQRGGILDIFAPDWEEPVRLEFFGDDLESLRTFDVATQRSLGPCQSIDISIMRPEEGARGQLADYLPPGSWVLIVEPAQVAESGEQFIARLEHPETHHTTGGIWRALERFARATAAGFGLGADGPVCDLRIESVERFSGEIAKVRDELDRTSQDQRVVLVASTSAEAERLREVLAGTRLAASGRLEYVVGRLRHGFRLVPEQLALVGGSDLFQRGEPRRLARRHVGKAIDSFLELRPGDLVVHLAHGIGRYNGLQLLERHGRPTEHLEIEFHAGTKLFVPASRIDLVQKYVGGVRSRPHLARIGGKSWVRQKQAAEHAVHDVAVELLELQAARRGRPGIAFQPDSDWQREFDASFPYHETDDQLSAVHAIKSDMSSARPMDRLLCGDVGFGKTELAMRAAFKTVDSGFQVAVLVPTTILAEQHYQTFRERMAAFPIDIAKLSRFCSAKEIREVLDGLATGRMDVVIGTHRLASKDVQFHNLGLVVIDEEQRFGVEVKERLKRLRSTVDVLTMTATPIPRTLHMALVGVRDISNLETPPEDRLAVETRVTRFQPELIRHAVLREMNRGGQVFFVHNRVHDIELIAQRIRQIVPEAQLEIAHGQMPEDQLERVMIDFVHQRFDLLLATTIVESGLDIPNANTIFIDDADGYGLADLHQLRGRVGRYKHRAYCYLLIDPRKHVTPNAAKRLLAIEEFSDLGAGFALAMRDLEIRGAGNLLGTEQSGHIATVGYELYCQLLENAIRSLQQLPPKRSLDVDVELPAEAYLPESYVGGMRAKIDLYRRLSRISHCQELGELRDELRDRFGPPPEPVIALLELSELRIEAAVWQLVSLGLESGFLVLGYSHRPRIEQLRRALGGQLRIVDDEFAYLPLPEEVRTSGRFVAFAKSVLRQAGSRPYNPPPRKSR